MYARCAGNPGAVDTLTRKFRAAAQRLLDWSEETADTLVRRPIKQILLLHVNAFVALTLDDLLSDYEKRGVRFIAVREALDEPVYWIDPKVTWRGQEDFLTQLLRATGRTRPRPPLPREGCHTD